MQNPVTGSGGMLLGEVAEVGSRHPAAARLSPGDRDRVARLADADSAAPRRDRRHPPRDRARGRDRNRDSLRADALRAPARRLPGGASRWPPSTWRAPRPACSGTQARADRARSSAPGKAGLLCLAAAREKVGSAWQGTRRRALAARRPSGPGRSGSPTRSSRSTRAIRSRCSPPSSGATGGRMADLVVNVANAAGTEAASVLCARDDGAVLFFGMATSFSAAALGAEGLAKPTTLLIGNGFVPGHDETALALLRRHPALARGLRVPLGKPAAVNGRLRGARRDAADDPARAGSPSSASPRTSGRRPRSSPHSESCTAGGVAAGTTSAGRDGESFDAITGEAKPRFRVWPRTARRLRRLDVRVRLVFHRRRSRRSPSRRGSAPSRCAARRARARSR